MKIFKCQACGQVVYFENTSCEKCGRRLGYLPALVTISALEGDGEQVQALARPNRTYRFCANAAHGACNWLVEADAPDALCLCCRHNRTIPDLAVPENLDAWRRIEMAKHRLFYSLLRFRLPMPTRQEDPENGLAFDFLADPPAGGPRVLTGHDNGLITLALAEANDADREKRRLEMHEPYRTLLGHFRHEIGHYAWDRLVRDGGQAEACRALFGDDRQDYGAALQAHYANGAPAGWQERFVSEYATSHPWEDFAETWAHYLHIVDTLETARAFGLSTDPAVAQADELQASVEFDPYRAAGIDQLMSSWTPLSVALNSLNRAMGHNDLYPFVLAPAVVEKLGFIHALLQRRPAAALAA